MRFFGLGSRPAAPAPAAPAPRECRNPDHPDAEHWHYGYGQRQFSVTGPVADDFTDGTDRRWAKGAGLTEA